MDSTPVHAMPKGSRKKRENLGLVTCETPPPTPKCSQIWDFYRELTGNFRQKKGQICHKKE